MQIFYANPRSFNMDRKSPLAMKLKASVAEKLVEFLGNYSDDVLAEYIIVLVCHGKNQNQARDDLEAFLGEKSSEFVSWLWDLILKNTHESDIPIRASYVQDVTVMSVDDEDVDRKQRSSRLMDLQNHDTGNAHNPLTINEKCRSILVHGHNLVSSNHLDDSEGFQRRRKTIVTDELNLKEAQARAYRSKILKKSGKIEDTVDEPLYGTSRLRGSSRISAGGEQSMQYVNQDKKIVSSNCNAMSRQLLHSSQRELVSRKFQAVTENPQSSRCSVDNAVRKRISSRAAHSISDQNARSRGNVWDRLGKPCEYDTALRDVQIDVCAVPINQRKLLERDGESLDQLMPSVPGSILSRKLKAEVPKIDNSRGNIPMMNSDDRRTQENGVNICTLRDASNVRQKRHFAEIGTGPGSESAPLVDVKDRHLQEKETNKDFQRTSVANHAQSLKHVEYETRRSDGQDKCLKSDIAPSVRKKKVPPVVTGEAVDAANQSLVLVNCPLSAKQETVDSENNVNANPKPVQAQVLDVKLKLRQIEMEMSKLRSKQLEIRNDGKFNILPTSGALDHPDEDVELRTVFVTNVHFAATRDALSLYFSKCGTVVKVIILADPVTAQPKGSAYITFASKESVDKAVAISGTSFLSRTLKVMRKAEVPAVTSSRLAESPPQSLFNNTNRKGILQRQYTSSHLQWRRDLVENPEHSMSAPGVASDTPKTVEGST
ncbi:uncharacterized protein LOC122661976 isoform X2 [Telopea speciosissima]|uniref:uncharacterized protein LOC122661976 isoform X2 n=1 Tax=Telopea speciosissima TaxID=54955 RepID=UPI001CC59506|nr:uncharacterized protein LOC122661976 isoform X2 [Telopea speciosissima]